MLWKIWGDVCDLSQRLRTHRVVHHSWWRREEYLLQPNQPRMLNQGDSKKDTPREQMDICGDARTCFAMSSYSIKRLWTTQRDRLTHLRSDDKDWSSSPLSSLLSCPALGRTVAQSTKCDCQTYRATHETKLSPGSLLNWETQTFLLRRINIVSFPLFNQVSTFQFVDAAQSKLWIICFESNHLFIQFGAK